MAMTSNLWKLAGSLCFSLIVLDSCAGDLFLEDSISQEDEEVANHNLWINPTVEVVKKLSPVDIKWSGPWNYNYIARVRQLPSGVHCWYCNVWLGSRFPPGVTEDAAGGQKCIPTGQNCELDSDTCCDPAHPGQTDELCHEVLKKCVKCRPSIGEECSGIGRDCCEKNVLCFPKPGGDTSDNGVCKKLDCVYNGEDACSAGRKCCKGFECKMGKCKKCGGRGCNSNSHCCASYFCVQGQCHCQGVAKTCSSKHPCCPNLGCVSDYFGDYFKASNFIDPVCVPRTGCASGETACPKGKVCVNDVCVRSCVRRNHACHGPGDSRGCCNNGFCQSTRCKQFCDIDYSGPGYCTKTLVQPANCRCGLGKICKKNGDCAKGLCCIYQQGSICTGFGLCKDEGKKPVIGGCKFGDNSAITSNCYRNASASQRATCPYKECPK